MRISDWSSDVCSSDLAAAFPCALEQFQEGRLRELGRAADAALARIDLLEQTKSHLVERLQRNGAAGKVLRQLAERFFQGDGVLLHAALVVGVDLRHRLQNLRKARPTVARLRRKIGAAPEGLAVGSEEHGERPAALLAEQGQGRLVDADRKSTR